MYGYGASQMEGSYGAMGPTSGSPEKLAAGHPLHKHRPRVSLTAVLICFFAPCLLFTVVCGALSFSIRHTTPALTYIAVGGAAVAVLACCYYAFSTVMKRMANQTMRDPFWYVFLAVTLVLAWGYSFWLGETNYWNNVLPSIDLQSLSSRYSVDPSTTLGQQLMDVGTVFFSKGTKLDVTRSMGFKNVDTYCVAPIVMGDDKPESFDFWAIGLDCCSGGTADFHCGEFDNPRAKAGLRLMREDQRAFYRLAVEQATSAYDLHARYPLFFYWMEDPTAELDSYVGDAKKAFFLGILSFAALQLLLVLIGVVVHAKF